MPERSLFKKLYLVLTWVSFAGLVVVLLLVLRKSPPPNIPFDPSAAARAEQKFEAADQAKAAGQPGHVALDATELNSYLKQNLELEADGSQPAASPAQSSQLNGAPSAAAAPGLPSTAAAPGDPTASIPGADQATLEQVQSSVKDVKVDIVGDLVKAYVIFDFHGKDLSLELDGHLGAENGFLKFEPVSGKLGSMPLSQSMLNSTVQKLMASPENREKLRLPSDISDIQIVNGQAVVTYK
jgi:hypothetical protein